MDSDTMNTGGPAFPEVRISSGDNYNPPTKLYYSGMTMRDYFAAQWLTTFAVSPNAKVTAEEVAKKCYCVADAMLKAREAT